MSLETLEQMIAAYQGVVSQPTYVWQGGEPTLCGLDFFRRAAELQRVGSQNSFQTNGLLLDEEWCLFFLKHNWLVGLSVDGPTNISRGILTEKLEEIAAMLKFYRVRYNLLCVVSEENVNQPERVVNHLAKLGGHVQFIVQKPVKIDATEFFRRALKWAPKGLVLEDVGFTAQAWVGMSTQCELLQECGVYFVVESDGSLYPCDFYVKPEWNLGNVYDDDLGKLFQHGRRMRDFRKLKTQKHSDCEPCEVRPACGRGCPYDRDNGGKTMMCGVRKLLGHGTRRVAAKGR